MFWQARIGAARLIEVQYEVVWQVRIGGQWWGAARYVSGAAGKVRQGDERYHVVRNGAAGEERRDLES